MKTAKIKSDLSFLLAEVLCLFVGLFSSVDAQQKSASPFAGTTWVSTGGNSTIVFAPDGTWTEHWRQKNLQGTWRVNDDNTEVVVTRSDNVIFNYKLNDDKNLIRDHGFTVYQFSVAAASNPDAAKSFASSSTTDTDRAAPAVKLTDDQARAVVLIKGDNAEGTGFLIKTADGPVVVTNIHVISNNPNLKITTNDGTEIAALSYKGAKDRDLAMIAVKDGGFKYLELATDISSTVQPGDEVITPGNSEGGEVMLNTDGKVLGIGPERIEVDNPIYHGNSGGPVFHVKSGKVIGVVTEAFKVDTSNELDKASFANRNSAIRRAFRYFGLRLDNVSAWEAYDWDRFQNETAFLDQFDQRSRCLDSYLNAPDDDKPEDILWRSDDKIVKANTSWYDQSSGADVSQRMDATRALYMELSDLVNINMDAIQVPDNFYSFDQQRAKDEIAYRKALKAELNDISKDISRESSLPRTNNDNSATQ